MDRVIGLRRGYGLREVAYRVLLSVESFLREYYYNDCIGFISF
jgi:hypothetical protein